MSDLPLDKSRTFMIYSPQGRNKAQPGIIFESPEEVVDWAKRQLQGFAWLRQVPSGLQPPVELVKAGKAAYNHMLTVVESLKRIAAKPTGKDGSAAEMAAAIASAELRGRWLLQGTAVFDWLHATKDRDWALAVYAVCFIGELFSEIAESTHKYRAAVAVGLFDAGVDTSSATVVIDSLSAAAASCAQREGRLAETIRNAEATLAALGADRSRAEQTLAESLNTEREKVEAWRRDEEKSFKKSLDEWVGAREKELKTFREDREKELTDLAKSTQASMSGLQKKFREGLALKAAAEHWDGLRKEKSKHAKGWGIAAAGWWVAATVGLVLASIYWIQPKVSDLVVAYAGKGAEPPFLSITSTLAPYVLLTFVFIWVGRLLTRNFQSNRHLEEDARNRSAATLCFLALLSEHEIKSRPKDLQALLSSLFRPAFTGLVPGEVLPESGSPIVDGIFRNSN